MGDIDRFLNANDAARFLGIKKATLYAWKSRGLLPCYKPSGIKGTLLFKKEELLNIVEKGKVVSNGDTI